MEGHYTRQTKHGKCKISIRILDTLFMNSDLVEVLVPIPLMERFPTYHLRIKVFL